MEERLELYRKYRPSTLDDMVGNEATIKSLKKELENGSRVFLMTGNAGCGKTTLARIMSKEVNAGELSITEINSANNRGIDTAREIMEKMRYNPSDGDSLVFILDEVHMITSAGQNAFLKALEDTPPHVYFFLCTTNPEKLIEPLKTRCSIINVKPLNDKEMKFLIKRTCRAENVKISPDVLEKIVSIAQGGSRKALKLLAKVIYLDDESEQLEVLQSDDVAESQETIEFCRALLGKDCTWSKLSSILKNMDVSEPEKIRMAVMGYMNSVLLNGKMNQNAVCALQAFGQNPTYNNGKFQLTIALLDFFELME